MPQSFWAVTKIVLEPVVVCGSIDTFTVLELDPELTIIPAGTVQL